MSVKPVQSTLRALKALELIAQHQPLGVADLARRLEADKSNVQRTLITLAHAGWIQPVPDGPTRWALTNRVLTVASHVHATSGLEQLIRPLMVSLRDETDETVICAIADVDRVVITNVVESLQVVRSSPPVGFEVPTEASASGRALLASMDRAARDRLAGRVLGRADHLSLDAVRERGWSLNAEDVAPGSTSVGAAVLDASGFPIAAIAVSALSERMPPAEQDRVGELLRDRVQALQFVERGA